MDNNKTDSKPTGKKRFGRSMNFASAEAYKLLRTNVSFSFSAEVKCPVIAVTSSLRGEGKSTTSVNLAYTIAEADKRVLLIDADMRLPSVARKLELALSPGLSNLLVRRIPFDQYLQHYGDVNPLDILTAGDVPPNPSELLGSERMSELIADARTKYDYIIVDMPPVTAVSDALALSRLLDGVVLVARNNYASKNAIKETIRQLKLVNVKVIGFVSTFANGSSKTYGKNYGKYGYGKDAE